MSYPQDTRPAAQPKPYKDRRASARMLRIDGLALIAVGLLGGIATVRAPAFMWVLTLAIIGVVVWAVGQIRETLEHPCY
ncbi:hypothetical protein NUV30_11715 [Kocuria rhizophila]|uniref:hypothetical protein n=1 Tax=Kocuria TaxID=57493 RepID=UPI0021501F7D|nr:MULTISPECIES: hypothetical protein [Kocuria]MCR4527030.1 hypothetical protein [Kocuria rhizophila]MCT1545321.1 hypothetical protein [Kocuria rhizophila]MCT2171117.1 hypothetical protein [Kocuria rhizophila]MDN3463036.1 hypothetical protein [Kocuria sp. APC 4018]